MDLTHFSNDGSGIERGVVTQVDGTSGSVSASHSYVNNGVYPVEVCVIDNGNPDAVGCDSLEVTVTNADPEVTIINIPTNINEGDQISLSSVTTDRGNNDIITTTWSAMVNNTEVATANTPDFTFTPNNNGTYQITVTVNDEDGGTNTAQTTITVTNADPEVTIINGTDNDGQTSIDGMDDEVETTVSDEGDDAGSITNYPDDDTETTTHGGPDDTETIPDDNDSRTNTPAGGDERSPTIEAQPKPALMVENRSIVSPVAFAIAGTFSALGFGVWYSRKGR